MDFYRISIRLKKIISEQEKRMKILDKDVAKALGLDPQYYAVIKRRNKIPYEAIAFYCKEYKISMNWILLNQEPEYLT